MEISDLRVFEAVARLGSMNQAAAELNTVQSNVTARIRMLEEELGVPLFQRHARGVTSTRAGQRLMPFVSRIKKILADAQEATKDDGIPRGPLNLGSMETTAALRLSPILTSYLKNYPQVRLSLVTGTTSQLLIDVIECRLDGAFVAGPVNHPDLYFEKVFSEELVLVTPPNVTSLKKLAAVDDLNAIVFRVGCSYRQRLESVLAELGLAVAKSMEFGSLDMVISCVAAGVGVTLLPKSVIENTMQRGRFVIHQLPPKRALAETLFVRRRDAYLSSALAEFLRLAREYYSSVEAA